MLNHALAYLRKGLCVIPLREKGKEPLYPWQEFQKRLPTEAEVQQWWTAVPNANIGIVTGSISNLVVVDLDGPEGLDSATKLGLKSTVFSATGRLEGGKHLWFKHPGFSVTNAVKTLPGLDVRGDGGYVVAPPSIHPSGRRYLWTKPLNLNSLLEFPGALLVPNVLTPSVEVKEESWIAKALEGMKDGNIDNTIVSVLGRLRNDGYTAEDARVLLSPHMERVKAESGHLEEKIENVWNRYDARKTTKGDEIGRRTFGQTGFGGERLYTIHSPTNPDSIKQYAERQSNLESRECGLQTGYPKLDEMLKGGLKSSRLFTVAARTGTGKTNWLIGVARSLCQSDKKVLLFSTEMPYTEIWERYIQTLENADDFRKHSFYVCDSFAPNIERVEEAIKEIKPDVFMFDHINHVSEEQRELGAFMQGLNYLRRKYDMAGIVAAQLNRSADWIDLKTGEKVTPRMSMIKGSGTIEQASSRVLLLSETRVTPEGSEIVGNLDKNDNGDKGLLHFILTRNPYIMREA